MRHRNYAAAVSRYKEVITKYPDYSRMPGTLFNMAEGLRHGGNESEAAIYYARIITEHPLSNRIEDARQHLRAMNQPIPDPNPGALARAQSLTHDERGILGKMFGMFKSRPAIPTETSAVSRPEDAGDSTDSAPAPVRGGTAPASGANPTGNSSTGGGTFNVDAKGEKEPAKTPR